MLNPADNLYAFKSGDFEIIPSGHIGESYDDNITYAKEGTKSDLITELSAAVTANYEGKKALARACVAATQNIFAKNSKYDNNSQYLEFALSAEPSKLHHLDLHDKFSHVYEPQNFNEAFGINAGRYSYLRNYFTLGYGCDISKQSSAGASYSNSVDIPSRTELADSYSNDAGAYLSYAVSSSTIVSGHYSFSARTFNEPRRSAYTNSAGVSFKQYLTKQAYIEASSGFDQINSYNNKDFFRPYYRFSLTDDLDESRRASIIYEKKFSTNAYSEDVFNYWKVSGYFIWKIARRLGFFGSVFAGRGTYVVTGVKDRLLGGSLGLTYDMTKHLKCELSYRYSISTSNLQTDEYKKNTVFLGARMEF